MGALDGLLVIAIEQAVAAPLCTLRLADAGARVIKIERKEGETARHYDSAVHGTSTYFAWLNRGKESAVLDLKSPPDLAVLRQMLAKADVLVQNLAPGALGRLGLGPEVLENEFPHLIAVSIVGYGQDTPYAQMKAYDMLVQAESGICAVTGTAGVPSKVGVPIVDLATGANAHAAVLEALIARSLTGKGALIEIAMFDAMADWITVPLLHHEHAGTVTGRHGLSHASVYPYRPFKCSDGTLVIAVQTAQEWAALCTQVIERPDLLERPDFASNALRVTHRDALDLEMEPAFHALTLESAIRRCTRAKVAWARYRSVEDIPSHPALRQIDVTLEDGTVASLPRPAGMQRHETLSQSALTPPRVPALGADSDEIRAEFAPKDIK